MDAEINLWGDAFTIPEITIKDEKKEAKKVLKKVSNAVTIEDDNKKIAKSKSIPMEERLQLIKDKVYRILGKRADNILVIRDEATLHQYILDAINAGRIDIDTETNNTTNSANCKLMGLCLYAPGLKQVYVPVNHVNYLTKEKLPDQVTEQQIKQELQLILDNNIPVIMHNCTFDYQVLHHTCDIKIPAYWDTFIAAKLLDENELAGLKPQYKAKIDPEQEKYDIEELFEGLPYEIFDPEIFAFYASQDAYMTDKLYEWQVEKFKDPDLAKVYQVFRNVEQPETLVVAKMEEAGVLADAEYNKRLHDKYWGKLNECDEKINKELEILQPQISAWKLSLAANEKPKKYATEKDYKDEKLESKYPEVDTDGKRFKYNKSKAEQLSDPINMGSPTQMAILFYDILQCPSVSKKSPRGTGEEEMQLLARATSLALCKLLVERRGIMKLISTYIDNIPELIKLWPDGRIRTHFNQYGAATGRFSSGGKVKFLDEEDKNVEVNSVNLQNVPSHCKELRMTYVAGYDEKLQETDENNSIKVFKSTALQVNDSWISTDKLKVGDVVKSETEETTITNIEPVDDYYQIYFSNGQIKVKVRIKKVLVGSDYSAQEPRLCANYAGDESMINAYKEGKDLYSVIASSMFNNNYEDNLEFYPEGTKIVIEGKEIVCGRKTHLNKAGKARRSEAKSVLIGLLYGRGPASMAEQITDNRRDKNGNIASKDVCTVKYAQDIINKFFTAYPKVKEWIEKTQSDAHKNGYVEDWYGRRRRLPDILLPRFTITQTVEAVDAEFNPLIGCANKTNTVLIEKYQNLLNKTKSRKEVEEIERRAKVEGIEIKDNSGFIALAERQSVNARVQGGASTLTKLAMIAIDKDQRLKDLGFRLLITIHDEVIGDCYEENSDKVSELLPQIMIDTAAKYLEVPMKCDPTIESRWYESEQQNALETEFKKGLESGLSAEEAKNKVIQNHVEMLPEEIEEIVNNLVK